MKLSIIVPVYGVEKYILEFAQSLIFQIDDQVELIIINDGTKDKSIEILKKYIDEGFKSQKNIIWLEQENQGQSVARNYGIEKARGKYITFLDPDDYVNSNYVNVILVAINLDPDLIHFNAKIVNNKCEIKGAIELASNNELYNMDISQITAIYNKCQWFSWLRVIKKEYLCKDFFPKNVNYQDMMAFPKVYRKINKLLNVNKSLVNYRVYQQSSVNGFKPKLLTSANKGLNIYNSDNYYDKIIYKQFIKLTINLISMNFSYKEAGIWYYQKIFKREDRVFYNSYFMLIYYISLIFCLKFYRNLKFFLKV